MEIVPRLQGHIRGRLVRQAISQVRAEYEQIVAAVENPSTIITWPAAAVLGKPRFVYLSLSGHELPSSTNTKQHSSKMLPATNGTHYLHSERQSDELIDAGQATCKTGLLQNESAAEATAAAAAAATSHICAVASDEQETGPLLSSSPRSNDHQAIEHFSDRIVDRQTLLSSCSADSSSIIHVGDPVIAAEAPLPHLKARHSLSLCRDDTAFAGGSESESMSDSPCDDQDQMIPKTTHAEENTDLDSWAKCLPSDKVALYALQGDMLMELLWIDQAIGSRMEYLAIKAKIGAQQS